MALLRNPRLNNEFFIDCFVGGLKEEIQLGIQEFGFTTLKVSIKLARVEETKIEAWLKRSKAAMRTIWTSNTVYRNITGVPTVVKPTSTGNGANGSILLLVEE